MPCFCKDIWSELRSRLLQITWILSSIKGITYVYILGHVGELIWTPFVEEEVFYKQKIEMWEWLECPSSFCTWLPFLERVNEVIIRATSRCCCTWQERFLDCFGGNCIPRRFHLITTKPLRWSFHVICYFFCTCDKRAQKAWCRNGPHEALKQSVVFDI